MDFSLARSGSVVSEGQNLFNSQQPKISIPRSIIRSMSFPYESHQSFLPPKKRSFSEGDCHSAAMDRFISEIADRKEVKSLRLTGSSAVTVEDEIPGRQEDVFFEAFKGKEFEKAKAVLVEMTELPSKTLKEVFMLLEPEEITHFSDCLQIFTGLFNSEGESEQLTKAVERKINEVDRRDNTWISKAVVRRDIPFLQYLISHGGRIRERDVLFAFQGKCFEIVKCLIKNMTHVFHATMKEIFLHIEDEDFHHFLECKKILREKSSEMGIQAITYKQSLSRGKGGLTELMKAISRRDFALFYDLIEIEQVDLSEENQWKSNALFYAVYPERFKFLAYLVEECRLDIESRNSNRATPLFCAVDAGSAQAVRYLLNRNANPNIETTLGDTPLKRAIRSKDSEMVDLLILKGADIHAVDSLRRITPIMQATEVKDLNMVKKLRGLGCDINCLDKHDNSCISYAILKRDTPMLQYLVNEGAIVRGKDREMAARRNITIPSPHL